MKQIAFITLLLFSATVHLTNKAMSNDVMLPEKHDSIAVLQAKIILLKQQNFNADSLKINQDLIIRSCDSFAQLINHLNIIHDKLKGTKFEHPNLYSMTLEQAIDYFTRVNAELLHENLKK